MQHKKNSQYFISRVLYAGDYVNSVDNIKYIHYIYDAESTQDEVTYCTLNLKTSHYKAEFHCNVILLPACCNYDQ